MLGGGARDRSGRWEVRLENKADRADLATQLSLLQADYDGMRRLALGIEARGYAALLASVAFAGQARELRDRAVRLFNEAARVLRDDAEARNIRLRLLQTSEQLAALFDGGPPPERRASAGAPGSRVSEPTLQDLLYAINRAGVSCDGLSLHDRVLSVASAACGALHARR